jgi:hypothetical protein
VKDTNGATPSAGSAAMTRLLREASRGTTLTDRREPDRDLTTLASDAIAAQRAALTDADEADRPALREALRRELDGAS